ncbi:Chitin binding protein (plasmid) [Methanosarcina barkeri str. Wiesmoor]|uniref:Chitin binding protein n=2 Tax=Methanosarcina barkeri TaxID=2208 RepID=A0A0E3QHL1_METBA|nr:PKD domain-containing protein [Methanosarcina barkeri]AKB49259.1 Chitin binding protein [Methanosarcina barkeri str. Wiesmoor]
MVSKCFFLPVIVGISLLVSGVQAAPVTNGLVVYYDGNLSGSFLVDLSGNNNTGYATNVTSGTNQLTGANYINLNGFNSSIDVSNNAQTNISSPISIEFIGSIHEFKPYGALVSKYDDDEITGWYLDCSAHPPYQQARFVMCAWNATSGTNSLYGDKSVGTLDAGQIYHIVVTYDSNTASIYINGVNSGTSTWNLPIVGNSKNITIGSGSGIPNGNCSMYVFRLYNRALSPDEVWQNYVRDRPIYMMTPTIIWSNPADITYGTALSSTQLNAVATDPVTGNTVTGNFTYDPAAGTILSEGTQTLNVDFASNDTANYTNATANVTINVNPVPPVANFSYAMVNNSPLTIQFTDTSISGVNYQWNFGDGSSNVTLANPLHTFASPGAYSVQETVSNALGSSTKTQNVDVQYPTTNLDVGELQLWTFDASKVSDVPNNIYTTTKNIPYTSNVSLKHNSTLGSIDSSCWHGDNGETYITGAYPTVNQNLTFTMGIDSNSQWSYGYLHTSVADIGVRHASDGSYWIYSYWTNDTGSQLSSSYQIPATSVVNNKVTVSIHSYDSNRTNVITSGPALYVITPYTTEKTRKLPYTNVIQPLIYETFYASGTDGWVNVHLYNITQSIPRDIITPYARNDIMAFGLVCPNVTNNQLGTDFLISHNQSATVFVSGGVDENEVEYNEYLFNHGFEEGIHFYPGLASQSLADSETIIDTEMDHVNSLFGAMPASWSSHANDDNITHAIYIYQRYGALYRTGYQGMGFISNSINLQNNTWYWWNISSARGAISPCFTHQTDIDPAPLFAIDPDFFSTFVTNLNSNGINLVGFTNWYCSSMAQTAITNVLQYDENNIKFQLNTSGGYPVNMNVQTMSSPLYLYCDAVSIPFNQTSDGIQFMSVGNGTYTLTNTSLATPSITWSNPGAITYGTALSSTQLNATASVPGTLAYHPAAGTILSAGTHPLQVIFTPTDSTNYTTATSSVSLAVNRATPLITWNTPSAISSGTSLSETQLNANASVLGNFTYNPASGTVLSVGTHTLHVDFMPTDVVNYTNATANVTINVSEKLVLPVANFTASVTSGAAPLSVQFNDSSENATAWSWDFGDGQTSTVQNPSHTYSIPGTYTVSLNVSNADGYNISTKSNLITVNPNTPPVTNGLVVYYDGSLSGNSLVDLSGNNNIGYATNVTSGTNQLTGANYIDLNGFNSSIDVSNNAQTNISSPVSIEFIGSINEFKELGTLVSKYNDEKTGWYLSCSTADPNNHLRVALGLQSGALNMYNSDASLVAGQVYDIVLTYDNNTVSVYINGVNSGTRTWNSPIAGLTNNISIGSGTRNLSYGNCSMYAFRLYNRSLSSAEVLQNYNSDHWRYSEYTTKVSPTIIWAGSVAITYGTALSEAQLNANASVPGTFVYSPASGTIPGAGTHTLQTTFTPTDTTNYTMASSSVSLTVNKAIPLVTWSNPADITSGTALGSTQLDAFASVPGSFAYNPVSGTVLRTGTHALKVRFTPADTTNYTTVSNSVSLTVNKAIPLITWSNPADITSGTALSSTQLNANASVPGTFVYTPATGTVLNAGTHTLHVDFTPADTASYKSASKDVTINVVSQKMIPIITWNTPADITYGTALDSAQLNALASVPGSFAYTPALGTVLSAGMHNLSLDFTPADLKNHTMASGSVSLIVNKAAPLITWNNPADMSSGTSLSETQLNAAASVPGSFAYTPAAGTILSAGTHTLQVTFTPTDTANYIPASSSVLINIVNDAHAKSSSSNKKYNLVKQKILAPNSTQSSNLTEGIEKEIKSELGNEAIDQHNKSSKGLQTEQKETQNTPGFGIACGVACLFGVLLYKRE